MKWKAAPTSLVRTFEDVIRHFPQARVRNMFGFPAAFVNGNMLGGLFQDSMMLRLRDQAGATPFEPMPGRVMREYVVVPEAVVRSKAELRRWVSKAFAYTSSLPAKPAKARSKRTARVRPS